MDLFAMQFSIPQSWCNHSKLWRRWQRRRRSLNSRDTLTRCWARRDWRRQTKRKFDIKDVESYGRQKLKFYDMRRQSGSMLHIERLMQINTTNLWHWHAWGTGRLTDSCLKHINTGRDMKRHKHTVGWTLRLREGHMIKKAKKSEETRWTTTLRILERHSDGVLHAAERLTEGEKRPRPKLQRSEAQQAADAVDCNFIQMCSNLFKGPKPTRLPMPLTARWRGDRNCGIFSSCSLKCASPSL